MELIRLLLLIKTKTRFKFKKYILLTEMKYVFYLICQND